MGLALRSAPGKKTRFDAGTKSAVNKVGNPHPRSCSAPWLLFGNNGGHGALQLRNRRQVVRILLPDTLSFLATTGKILRFAPNDSVDPVSYGSPRYQ